MTYAIRNRFALVQFDCLKGIQNIGSRYIEQHAEPKAVYTGVQWSEVQSSRSYKFTINAFTCVFEEDIGFNDVFSHETVCTEHNFCMKLFECWDNEILENLKFINAIKFEGDADNLMGTDIIHGADHKWDFVTVEVTDGSLQHAKVLGIISGTVLDSNILKVFFFVQYLKDIVADKCDQFDHLEWEFSYQGRNRKKVFVSGFVEKSSIARPAFIVPYRKNQVSANPNIVSDRFYHLSADFFDRSGWMEEAIVMQNRLLLLTNPERFYRDNETIFGSLTGLLNADNHITDQDEFGSGEDVEDNINIESDEDY